MKLKKYKKNYLGYCDVILLWVLYNICYEIILRISMIYGYLWLNLLFDFVFRMKIKDWLLKVLVNNFMGIVWLIDLFLIKEVCFCLY